ncbi:hypothetical protein GCM10010467_19630 [Actinocorallia glomerata]|uniref:Type II toxin-antitoxin system VapC family toxin n=2 Tax=Actinomycetes TaxID=1760 RepID=A0ABP6LZ45_9MICC
MNAWASALSERHSRPILEIVQYLAGHALASSAVIHAPDQRPLRDALIAATVMVHQLTVVTRNVCDFEALDVPLIDPWGIGSSDRDPLDFRTRSE